MQLSLELNKPEWRAGITLNLWSFRLMPFTKTKKSIKMLKDARTAATAASAFVSIQSFVWRLRHFSAFRNYKKFIGRPLPPLNLPSRVVWAVKHSGFCCSLRFLLPRRVINWMEKLN
jgi:hypothetical protein